jgi:hypothetical protein
MGDSRHKRRYPQGPRREMNKPWKDSVLQKLADNKKNGVYPSNQSELAEAVGALLGATVHKTAITKMFQAQASKLVDPICAVLGIPHPTTEHRGDELQELVSQLSGSKRAKALAILKLTFGISER